MISSNDSEASKPGSKVICDDQIRAVPIDLRQRHRFVVWCFATRGAHTTKVPCNARTGRECDVTDPNSWVSFEDAVTAASSGIKCTVKGNSPCAAAGIGYVFAEGDGLAGVDIDGCVNSDGIICNEAKAIIDQLASYSEISPSGTGVKVFLSAKKTHKRCRTDKVKGFKQFEVYDQKRFFTLTGNHLAGTPRSIEPRQQELDTICRQIFGDRVSAPGVESPWSALMNTSEEVPEGLEGMSDFVDSNLPDSVTDEAIIQRACSAKNGDKFNRLWHGDITGYGSQSEADLALCSILAFYCGNDAGRIDRLFRQSSLNREKWDRSDYRDSTIQRAISSSLGCYAWASSPERTCSWKPQFFEGPHGLSLTPLEARAVGKNGKVMISCRVEIDGQVQPPITFSTVRSSHKDATNDLYEWLRKAKADLNIDKKMKVDIGHLLAHVSSQASLILSWSLDEQAKIAQATPGRTIQEIVIENAAKEFGITFRNDDGSLWSESERRNITHYEFKDHISKSLLHDCEVASDFPQHRIGRSAPVGMIKPYLSVAFVEYKKQMPREVDANIGPDSAAAFRYRSPVRECFNHTANWRWIKTPMESTEVVSLAGLVRDQLINPNEIQPRCWRRIHNRSIDAWMFVSSGSNGSRASMPVGETVCWLAMTWELPKQLAKSGARIHLPNTNGQEEFEKLAHKYGLAASGDRDTPPPVVKEFNRERRVLVLSREICDEILWGEKKIKAPY